MMVGQPQNSQEKEMRHALINKNVGFGIKKRKKEKKIEFKARFCWFPTAGSPGTSLPLSPTGRHSP